MTSGKNKIFSAFFITALLVGTVLASNISNIRGHVYASLLPSTLINLSNQNRVDATLPKLKFNSKLQKAAELQAQSMAVLDGATSQDSWSWLKQVGYNYNTAGQNIAVNLSGTDDNNFAWINSPEHQANLLNKNYSETGIGTAAGTYRGQPAIFIVQYFAQPSPVRENILTPNLQAYNSGN